MSGALLSVIFALLNPLLILACWLGGTASKKKPIALLVGICSGIFAQTLFVPVIRIFEAMEGKMGAGRWPSNIEFIAGGIVASIIVTLIVWEYANSSGTNADTNANDGDSSHQ
jgi:hypothetical protein